MTNEELITRLTKQNEEMKDILKECFDDAQSITSSLYSVGGPLNDNILNFNKEQRNFLRRIDVFAQNIMDLIPNQNDD